MNRTLDRRGVMKTAGVMVLATAAGTLRGSPAFAQPVPWSSGTEAPKLKAPANACDCHMHIYPAIGTVSE
jgi:D-galactarolactone isomerase